LTIDVLLLILVVADGEAEGFCMTGASSLTVVAATGRGHLHVH
jgi:hypothetical protein